MAKRGGRRRLDLRCGDRRRSEGSLMHGGRQGGGGENAASGWSSFRRPRHWSRWAAVDGDDPPRPGLRAYRSRRPSSSSPELRSDCRRDTVSCLRAAHHRGWRAARRASPCRVRHPITRRRAARIGWR
jgi:hypothetical protein